MCVFVCVSEVENVILRCMAYWFVCVCVCVNLVFLSVLGLFELYSFLLCVWVYRVAKTHRMPYLYRSFSAKEPYD